MLLNIIILFFWIRTRIKIDQFFSGPGPDNEKMKFRVRVRIVQKHRVLIRVRVPDTSLIMLVQENVFSCPWRKRRKNIAYATINLVIPNLHVINRSTFVSFTYFALHSTAASCSHFLYRNFCCLSQVQKVPAYKMTEEVDIEAMLEAPYEKHAVSAFLFEF